MSIKQLTERMNKTLKHMRGRHDQRDHAWNRGMGRGGGGTDAAVSQPNKPTVNAEQYRENLVTLQQLVNQRKMSYHDMRNEQRKLRGYEPLPPRTRKQKVLDNKALAQAEANVVENAGTQTNLVSNADAPTSTESTIAPVDVQPVLASETDAQAKPSKYGDKFSGLTSIQDIINQAVDILKSNDAPSTTEEFADFLSYIPSYTQTTDGQSLSSNIANVSNLSFQMNDMAQRIAKKNESNDVPLDVITVGDHQFTTRPIRTWEELASISGKLKENYIHTLDSSGTAVTTVNVFAQNDSGFANLFPNIPKETPPRIINVNGLKIYTGPQPKNIHEKSWLKLFYGNDVSFRVPELGNSEFSIVDPSLVVEPDWVPSVIPETQLNEFRKKYNIETSDSELQKIFDSFTPEERQAWDTLKAKADESISEYVAQSYYQDKEYARRVTNDFTYIDREIKRLAEELGEDNPIVKKMRSTLNQSIIEKLKIPTPPDYLSDSDKMQFQNQITDSLLRTAITVENPIEDILENLALLTQSIAGKVPKTVSAAFFAHVNKLRLERGLKGPISRKMGTMNVYDKPQAAAVIPNPNPAATVDVKRQQNQPMTPKESAQNIINIFDSIKNPEGDAASEQEIANNARENFTKLTTIIQQLSPKEQMELIKNPKAMATLQEAGLARSTIEALGIFGHPDTRLEIAKKSQGEMRASIDENTVEVLLANYLQQLQSGISQEDADEKFARAIMNIHTSNKNNVLRTAAVHQLFSQVGPNAGVPSDRIRSFYVPGIVPPSPHPTAIEIMNRVYERQQAIFSQLGITMLPLYRGGDLQGGLPQESWSSAAIVSDKFAGMDPNNREFRMALIPVKYMFVNYATFAGFSDYNNEEEHTILGASMYYDGETDVRTTGNVVNANTPRKNLLNVMPQYQPSAEEMQFAVDKTRIQNIIDALKKIGAGYFSSKKENTVKSIKERLEHLSKRRHFNVR